jgi:hypothetical protein
MKASVEKPDTLPDGIRNPFAVMDVPDPDDQDVAAFARVAKLAGSSDDENAAGWAIGAGAEREDQIEGQWSSRWNGGADPSVPGDAKDKWKQGQAEVRTSGERVYLLFDWHHGARRALIDARRVSERTLVGKYLNLSNPAITRPWVGLIVTARRIDGVWPGGRLDFRR